ncbi:MAG: methionine--tRNA ligase [Candidatus Thermoplasmatota archaeon]|nr:methionine--tRNA ligase [Candidatus Thermoplasmatota archaeon]
MSDEHVLICVAWPYANGPLHLGHVAGCYLPPDIQYRFERALGNRVLMVSGSDEHGTPITVTAETQNIEPQQVVDEFHKTNRDALIALGCAWAQSIDPRGPEYGGALFNRTSDPEHKRMVQENFSALETAGFFERKTMEQYYEVHPDGGGRFLPDRYVEGTCPACGSDGARGDQCDACGATYEAVELKNPVSKMNPSATVEIRETDHLFYRLDLFQNALEKHAQSQQDVWKSNVKAMTKQWLDMGLRPRAVTRDLEWGIPVPMKGDEWVGKCVYVWFEAVQGYSTCARIWAARNASELPDGADMWKRWWNVSEAGTVPRHLYFLGKDNIPFHTVIWPALLLGLNHVNKGKTADEPVALPGPGEFALESNVPAMEYLMLAGGQFSKSRKHAIWLPSFLERYPADTLRYYLSAQMPEEKDSDFTWQEFVAKVNNVLNANYGNFVHRVLTLGARLPHNEHESPFAPYDAHPSTNDHKEAVEQAFADITTSLKAHRYKDALNSIMAVSQLGNQILQTAAPWKHLKQPQEGHESSLGQLAFCWRIARFLSITTQPFMPNSAQQLWVNLGNESAVSECMWSSAIDWSAPLTWREETPTPLFEKLDLDEIMAAEQGLVESEGTETSSVHGIKGGKKNDGGTKMKEETEGVTYLDFETFMEVNLRVGRITSVADHPNADKLYVVKLDDGTAEGRTICAGLKEYYTPEEMEGKSVVFVENLKPRPLRGITSEGMMLAADDGAGCVKLITVDGDVSPGSQVR